MAGTGGVQPAFRATNFPYFRKKPCHRPLPSETWVKRGLRNAGEILETKF